MSDYFTTCIWFDGTAEEAAAFYVTLMPDSHVDGVMRAPADNPSSPEGAVLVVEFTMGGQKFIGLNGGPAFKHSEAMSFQIHTDDQAHTDRLWNAIVSNGGAESMCGWCKDKWGVSWQITPKRLTELTADRTPGVAKAVFQAMMTMKKIDIAALEAAREDALKEKAGA
ncbi:MAG: VOC family protein [Sphingobium sp.]|nr:VOC family protein [Sphingobium sp.]